MVSAATGVNYMARLNADGTLDTTIAQKDKLMADLRVVITDAEGNTRHGYAGQVKPRTNLGDRDYFARLRDNPGAGLVVSKPVQGKVSRAWGLILARRLLEH